MAAPHVAGLAALILQAKDKKISPAMVRTLLMNTALPKAVNIAPTSGLLEPTCGRVQVSRRSSTQSRRLPGSLWKTPPVALTARSCRSDQAGVVTA